MKGHLVATTTDRSTELENIRTELRRHLDICARNRKRTNFDIQLDAKIHLSDAEERMMKKQITIYRHDIFAVSVAFTTKHRRRGPATTHIAVSVQRRKVPLKIRR